MSGEKLKGDEKAYNPSKSKYHPIDDACWKRNETYVNCPVLMGAECIIALKLKKITTKNNILVTVASNDRNNSFIECKS
jgi:hypothetical protein